MLRLKTPANFLVPLLVLLCAVASFGQESKCGLKLSELPEAPELSGFRMGMTTAQVKLRIPQVVFGQVNEFGLLKTSISPDFDPRIEKASLAGIRTVSLDFVDGRLTSLWFGFDGSFKWQTVPDFVKGISQSLRLPDAWRPWRLRGQQITCEDFQLTVSIVAEGPSFHIIDEAAEQLVAKRRAAEEEEREAATVEGQTNEIVADSGTMFYYPENCRPANEIKEADRVVFKTKEEAERAGYKLARNCQ